MSATERPAALFAGVEPLEVFVELLADLDTDTSSTEFYDRICEAICRLTTMRRAAIFMADAGRRRVRAVGSHGTSFSQLATLRPTLVNTPIAQRALLEDSVVVVSDRIEEAVPPEYAELLGITTLVCTPLSAGGPRVRRDLRRPRRRPLRALRRRAPPAVDARQDRRAGGDRAQRHPPAGARPPARRADRPRARDPRAGDAAPVRRVAGAGRRAAAGPEPSASAAASRCRRRWATCAARSSARWRRCRPRPARRWPPSSSACAPRPARRCTSTGPTTSTVPPELEPLAQSVLAEALRNAAKHADADPRRRRRSAATTTRSRSRSATTASRRGAAATPGWACGWPRSRRSSSGGVVEFGPSGERRAGGCGWWCRLTRRPS